MLRDVHALVPVWASRLGTPKWVLPSKGSRYTFLHCIHRKISHETWNVRLEQKPTGTRKMQGCPVFLSCLTSKSKNSGRAGRNLNFKLLRNGFWILHFVHAFAVLKFWKFGFCILGRDIECNMWVPLTPLDFWHAEFGSEDIGYYSWYRLNDSTFINLSQIAFLSACGWTVQADLLQSLIDCCITAKFLGPLWNVIGGGLPTRPSYIKIVITIQCPVSLQRLIIWLTPLKHIGTSDQESSNSWFNCWSW